MKVYIPHHSGAAGFWIYEGYRAAWEYLGFDTEYIEHITGDIPENTPNEYDAMLVEGALDYKEYKEKIDILNKVLKEEESIYEVSLIPENKLLDLLSMFPNQFVNYKGTGTSVYDQSYFGAI